SCGARAGGISKNAATGLRARPRNGCCAASRQLTWPIAVSKREYGTFSREDFTFNEKRSARPARFCVRPAKLTADGETFYYRSRVRDCRGCPLKAQCCPKRRCAESEAQSTLVLMQFVASL